jgi:hypothetical protein
MVIGWPMRHHVPGAISELLLGGKVFTTLIRNNFQDFPPRVLTESLSKTFKDAIITTRELRFRYLWIDSLCIIQGEKSDL